MTSRNSPIDWQARAVASPAVMIRQLGEESVLLDLSTQAYFGLDETGTRMWAALTQASNLEAAFATLRDEYEVEPARLRADMGRFVEALRIERLIEVVVE